MSIHRTQAIVLRSRKFRETSKIVVFFTQNCGKISAIAKGGLRPKSKFGSSLDIFTHSSIIFYKKENRDLHTLSHSEIVNPFSGVKQDVIKVAYASVAGEMVDRLVPLDVPSRRVFSLLATALGEIAAADRSQLEIVLSSYELKMLHTVGYGPELQRCVRCGKPVSGKAWFGLISGGTLCQACSNRDLNAVAMSEKALGLLREYEAGPISKLRQKYSGDPASREVSDLLNSFVRVQVGESAKMKSLEFLERMRGTGNA
jgi:DNA repair protein RecO (recombination protein O)